ncbi:MAG TPA: hypothetical protein GX528_02400, partial [Firmicutes bacterium]|nr:hypothetical protein [Bacillota bacterium]
DTDFLFELLKYGYAAYEYFGGEAAFLAAKENIKANLLAESFPLSAYGFGLILGEGLNFINDGHFAIGASIRVHSKRMYMNEEITFLPGEHGYYFEEENCAVYVEAVNGGEPEEYMWPALNEDGRIVYRLGELLPAGNKETSAALALAENGILTLTLKEMLGSRFFGRNIYERGEIDGIPVLGVSKFPAWLPDSPDFSRREHLLMQEFFQSAYELRGAEALIMDLRGHSGGDTSQGYSWLRNFTGAFFVKPAHLKARLLTETAEKLRLLRLQRGGDPLLELYEWFHRPREIAWDVSSGLVNFLENETVVVILTDKYTASGAERFVEALKQLENSVVIGTNTAGCAMGDSAETRLPNSQIRINFGVSLKLPLDLTDYEGRGILPDLWAPSGQALDLAVKFIHNYVKEVP